MPLVPLEETTNNQPTGRLVPLEESSQSTGRLVPLDSGVTDSRFESSAQEPMSRLEFGIKREREKARSSLEDVGLFFTGLGTGVGQLIETGIKGGVEFGTGMVTGQQGKILKSGAEGAAKSLFDLYDLGEAVVGRIGDQFGSDKRAIDRQYDRYLDDIKDAQTRQEGFLFDQNETFKNLTEVASIGLDPTNFLGLGIAGKISKVSKLGKAVEKAGHILDIPARITRAGLRGGVKIGAKGASAVAKVSAKPLRVLGKGAEKLEHVVGSPSRGLTNVIASLSNSTAEEANRIRQFATFGGAVAPIPGIQQLAQAELALAGTKLGLEGAARFAENTSHLLSALSDPTRQMRFLEKAIDPSSGLPVGVRRSLEIAGSGGTKALDLAFNSMANGLSAAQLQGVFATLATSDPEAIGSAVGTGLAFGAAVPVGPKGGVTPEQRTTGSTIAYLKKKFETNQAAEFKKMPANSQKLIASLSETGLDAKVVLQNKKDFLQTREHETGIDSKESTAGFIADDGSIFINTDASARDIDTVITHEVGHRIAREIITENRTGSAVGLRNEILKDFQDAKGIPLTTKSGAEIKVGGELKQFYETYNKNVADEFKIKDADTLVDEYMADALGVLFDETDFNAVEAMRRKPGTLEALSRVSNSFLGKLGLIDPETGGKPSKFQPISHVSKNPLIRRALNNHFSLNKAIENMGFDKDKGIKRKFGQSDESAIRSADVDPGEIFIPADLDIKQPGMKKLVTEFFGNTLVEPNQAAPGKTGVDIGTVISDSYLDAVNATPTMRRVMKGFESAIEKGHTVKFWKKKGKEGLAPKEAVPYGIIINKSNGNISVKYWNQINLNKVMETIKAQGLIDSVAQFKIDIDEARQRNVLGQKIDNEKIAALFGALPENLSTIDAKKIATIAQKRKLGFEQVSINELRAFKNYDTPGLGVRSYNALTNQRPDFEVPTTIEQLTKGRGVESPHADVIEWDAIDNDFETFSGFDEDLRTGEKILSDLIVSHEGEGKIYGQLASDGSKSISIEESFLEDQHRGKGLGEKMYLEYINQAKAIGIEKITSDYSLSPGSSSIYPKLKANGFDVVKSPKARVKIEDGVKFLVGEEPIYTINL